MKKRNIFVLLLCLLSLLSLYCVAYADSPVGSLKVLDIEKPVCFYYAADLNGELSETFAGLDLDNILDAENAVKNANALWEYAKYEAIYEQIEIPDEEGNIQFSALDRGIYLVASMEEEFLPFLVQIPTRLDGEIIYDIEARPKQEEPDPSDPSDPTEPTTPTKPSKPTVPTTPTDPSKPTVPTTPTDPSDPTVPTKPDDPTEPATPADPTVPSAPNDPTEPEGPEPAIPQTGISVIPMYTLLALGTVLTLAGLYEMIRGREGHHE